MKDTNILVTVGYPPMNFKKFKKGTKQNFNAHNKQIFNIKYNVEAELLMIMVKYIFKILL